MTVDYKVLNEEVEALARQMIQGDPKAIKFRNSIMEKLYIICGDEENAWVYYGPKKRRIPVCAYNEALLTSLGRYDPAKGASFATFFAKILSDEFAQYCKRRYSVRRGEEYEEVWTISLDETGADGEPIAPDMPDEFDFILEMEEISEADTLCAIAGIVADQKKLEAHCLKKVKTYIEAFFTADMALCVRFGGRLTGGLEAIDTEKLSRNVCARDSSFFPAMDDMMLEHLIDPPRSSMKHIAQNALRPGTQEPLSHRNLGLLLEGAYEGHPVYHIVRQTAYKMRETYDAWLGSLIKNPYKKEGYRL